MKRKFLSVILLICLILESIAIVYADGNSWEITYNGEVNTDRSKFFAKIDSEFTFDGDNALYVEYYPESVGEDYVQIKNTLVENLQAGSYTLQFYIRGTKSGYTEICVGNQTFKFSDMTYQSGGKTGWRVYTKTFDYEGSDDNYVLFRFYGGTPSAAIDNVSLTLNGKDLVKDGGFEETEVEEEPEIYDPAPYRVKNMMASSKDKGLVLNWINPDLDELLKIELYNITDGEEFVTDELDVTPGKAVYYYKENLSNGEKQQFKLVFSFSGGRKIVYYMGGMASPTTNEVVGAWNFNRWNTGAAGYCPGEIVIDTKNAKSGNASLKMRANIDTTVSSLKENIFLYAYNKIPMTAGKKYRVSYWIKGEKIKNQPDIHMGWVPFDGQKISWPDFIGDYDWTYQEYDYTYEKADTLCFIYSGICGGWWIDDIKVYELDESNSPIGDNLIKDGDFEDLVSTESAELSNVKVKAETGKLEFEWKAPANNYNGINVYEYVSDGFEYRGHIVKGIEKFSADNLKNGTEYTFKLVPVNERGVAGEGTLVTETTILPEYEIGEPVLRKDGEAIEKLSGAGKYSILQPIKNNLVEGGLVLEQFVAVYNSKNVLMKLYSTQDNIPKSAPGAKAKNIVTEFEIAEGDTAEFFVFDSRETWNIMDNYNSYKIYK